MMLSAIMLLAALGADVYQQTFEEANRAYYAGEYESAIQGYRQLTQGGVSDAAVFHNLGNSYYRTGQLGMAIVNFERALSIDPGLQMTRENLNRAVEQTDHVLARPRGSAWTESLLFWDRSLSYGLVRNGALFCWAALWAGAALALYRRFPYLRTGLCVAAILTLLLSASAWHKSHPPRIAVAVEKEVAVRYGMSVREKQRYALAEGDRVQVEDMQGGWIRIATASGERGWAQADSFALAFPPYETKEEKGGS